MKRRFKKNTSLLLAMLILLQIADFFSTSSIGEIVSAAEKINGFDNPCGYNRKSDGPIPSGVRPCNVDGYKFNTRLYYAEIKMNDEGKKSAPLQMIVYGDHFDVPDRSQDYKRGWANDNRIVFDPKPNGEGHFYVWDAKYGGFTYGEYRYLGFTIDGSLYHNNYYIVDDDTGIKLDRKHWVYQPWRHIPEYYRHKPDSPGYVYDDQTNTIQEQYIPLLRNIQRSIGFEKITQGVSYSNKYTVLSPTPENQDLRNYMAVNQPATAREAGFGTMVHYSWSSHSLWYQTVKLEKLKAAEKVRPPATCSVIPVDPQPIPLGKERIVKVNVKVKGTLQDAAFFGNLAAEAIFYTRREVSNWQLQLMDIQKNAYQTLQSNNKAHGVVVNENVGEGTFTLTIDTDKLTKTSNPNLLSYTTEGKATAIFANDTATDSSKSTSSNCKLDLSFATNGNGTMYSDFNVVKEIAFDNKSSFIRDMVGYVDQSYGRDVDFYKFEITNTDDDTKISTTFDPAIPEVKKPAAGYLDQEAVEKYLYDFIASKFQTDMVTERVVKTFHFKQTIVDRDATTNNESIALKTVVVVQNPHPSLTTGCSAEVIENFPKPPQYITPAANWPLDWYDVVPFPVTDGAPSYIPFGSCEEPPGYEEFTKKAYIDGNVIDVAQFFAGEYIFGEEQVGLREVKVVWTAPDGTESFMIQHVVIHESKPRVSMKIEGNYKQNRTMNAYNQSAASNDQWVERNAPIEITSFSFVDPADSNLKCLTGYCESNLSQKTFMYKKTGNYQLSIAAKRVIPYGNGKSITRYSDPYIVDYEIMPDHKPAIIAHAYESEVSRLDKLKLFYDVQSTDGDFIASKRLEVFYDSDNDGEFDIRVFESTGDLAALPELMGLGQYKIVVNAAEGTNEARLMDFITPADDMTHTFESYFFVDNYEPSSDLYMEVPNEKPDMDIFFMLDSNLTQASTDYIRNNRVTLTNAFTSANMLANVGIWDMKTYTYSQSGSTSRGTGTLYPPSTTNYTSEEGYSGTLTRTSVSNSPYSVDEGSYRRVTDSKTGSSSCSNTVTTTYDKKGNQTGQSDTSMCPDSMGYSDGPYSGTLSRSGTSSGGRSCSTPGPSGHSCSQTWTASYSGTLYWTHDVWEPKMVTYDSYTGFYSGTIYKDVRQVFDASFMRSVPIKFAIYISDNTVSQLADLEYVMDRHDMKLILVGQDDIQSQIASDKYISNHKAIEEVVADVISYIADGNPEIPKVLKLVGEEIKTNTASFDYEKDPIVKDELQIIQNPNYYDNSLGYESFAGKPLISEPNAANWSAYESTIIFNKPGKFTFMRRVKDMPSSDPNFAEYGYYSNNSQIEVLVHRKPIADVTLDFDYLLASNLYRTDWIDLSYDLDHSVTRAGTDRGIQARSIKLTNQGTGEVWTRIPGQVAPGTYVLDYMAQDIEGAWSDPVQRTFVLPSTVPVQMKSNLKTNYPEFSLLSVPAGENLTAFELWTRYPYAIGLQFAMGSFISRNVPYYTGTKTGNDIRWADEVFTIPNTTPDGPYTFTIRGNGSVAGSGAVQTYSVNVVTPINLTGRIDSEDSAAKDVDTIVVGESYKLYAHTTKYPDQSVNPSATTVVMFKGTAYQRTVTLTSKTESSIGYGAKSWSGVFTVGNMPNGRYTFEWRSRTPNGNVETVSKTIEVVNNRPPTADFTWSPNPVYEGDTVQLDANVRDLDGDTVSVAYELTSPSGARRTFAYVLQPNYEHAEPQFRMVETGNWRMRLTVSDGKAPPVTVEKSIPVRALHVSGEVFHTDLWNEHREAYNRKQSGNPESPRGYDVFWAGEKFVLRADTTVTGTLTRAQRVEVAFGTYEATLSAADAAQTIWTGELWDESFEELADGPARFVFTAYYSNGTVKTTEVVIQLQGDVSQIVGVHRVK